MKRLTSSLRFHHYLRVLLGLLGLGAIVAGVVTIAAWVNRMDVPTFLISLVTPQVSVQALMQGKLKPIVLVDVRSVGDYQADHIEPSVLIPLAAIADKMGVGEIQRLALATTQPDYTRPAFVLYDDTGQRSVQAYQKLKVTQLKLFVLAGGLQRWRSKVPANQDAQVLKTIVVPIPQRTARSNLFRTISKKPKQFERLNVADQS